MREPKKHNVHDLGIWGRVPGYAKIPKTYQEISLEYVKQYYVLNLRIWKIQKNENVRKDGRRKILPIRLIKS